MHRLTSHDGHSITSFCVSTPTQRWTLHLTLLFGGLIGVWSNVVFNLHANLPATGSKASSDILVFFNYFVGRDVDAVMIDCNAEFNVIPETPDSSSSRLRLLLVGVFIDAACVSLALYSFGFIQAKAISFRNSIWLLRSFFGISNSSHNVTYITYAFANITPIAQNRIDHHHFLFRNQWSNR